MTRKKQPWKSASTRNDVEMARRWRYTRTTALSENLRLSKSLQWGKAAVGPFAQYMKATIVYVQVAAMSTGPGTPDFAMWRLNSIHAPHYQGASAYAHQPMYHDQYATLYQQYRVDRAIVEVHAAPVAQLVPPLVIAAFVNTGAQPTSHLAMQNLQERLPVRRVKMTNVHDSAKFRFAVNIWDALGVEKKVFESSEEYWTAFATNPTFVPFLTLCAENPNILSTNDLFNAFVRIEYQCSFRNAVDVGGS